MKESMVIYESAYKAISYLPDEQLQLEAYRGLMEYGFYGIVPESDNPFVNMVYVQAIPSIRSAAERYEKAVEDGRRGGRPTDVPTTEIIKMKQSGMTNKQIAEKLGCTEKNIEKRVTTYNKSYPTNPTNPTLKDSGVHPTNPTNLSYTVSYTDTVSSTDTDSSDDSEHDICPEDRDGVVPSDLRSPHRFVSGDGLPGRRIRDLSETEADEIKEKLKRGVRYLDIEREYDMRSGTIDARFEENWKRFVWAKANGKL